MKDAAFQAPTSIAPRDLALLLKNARPAALLDVRTPPEYAAAHVPGTELLPLDALNAQAYLASRPDLSVPVFVFCQAGGRAAKAIEKFRAAGFAGCVLVEGGTQAWMDAGLPVERGTSKVIPLMRQVQIVIGTLSALGSGLALGVDVRFAILPLLMGCGLLFAGVSGICGLALLMAKLPWNRQDPAAGSCCKL